MPAPAVGFDSVGPQWGFHLGLFYETFAIVIRLLSPVVHMGERRPLPRPPSLWPGCRAW